jgi:hypothetical protein
MLGPEVFWGFGHGCLCKSIGGQASVGIVQGRGLVDTESVVPEGESKLRCAMGEVPGPKIFWAAVTMELCTWSVPP